MKFRAEIDIMPLKALLDPQGKTVTQNMINRGYLMSTMSESGST